MNIAKGFIVWALLVILISGCQKPPQPLQALPSPTTLFRQTAYLGSTLSGPTHGIVTASAAVDCLSVHVTFTATENVPVTPYSPVGSRAVFISSNGGSDAVLPAAELTREATIADLKDPQDLTAALHSPTAGRIAPMKEFTSALPTGVTAEFSALDPAVVIDLVTGQPTHRRVTVLVSRPMTGSPQLALELKDLVTRPGGMLSLVTEKALFELPGDDHTNTALVIPFKFDNAASNCVAVLVQIAPGSTDPPHVAATTQCIAQISQQADATQPMIGTGQADAWATVTAAMESLTPVAGRRSALAFLSDQTGASICEDLAMEANDATLAELVKNIQAKVAANSAPQTDPNVGWLLDQTALQLLARRGADAGNGEKVPTELIAILVARTGEVGRHASSMDEALKGLSTRQELNNRLLAANMIFLEDSSPASRVRAFDWLNARHLAPAGYDPLAGGKSRREALEKATTAP